MMMMMMMVRMVDDDDDDDDEPTPHFSHTSAILFDPPLLIFLGRDNTSVRPGLG